MIVELGFDPNRLRLEETHPGPVYGLTPDFEFPVERLQFLVWANNYDARSGSLIWWHAVKAARTLAHQGVVAGGTADVILGDGTEAYIDGGPPHPPSWPTAARSSIVGMPRREIRRPFDTAACRRTWRRTS